MTAEPFALLCCRIFLKVSYSLSDSLNKWPLHARHCSRPRGTSGHKTDKIICSYEAMFQYQRLTSNKIIAWKMLNSDELLKRKLKQRRAIGGVGGCWNFRQNDWRSWRDLSKSGKEPREGLTGYLGSKVWKTGNGIWGKGPEAGTGPASARNRKNADEPGAGTAEGRWRNWGWRCIRDRSS